ncbi:MAG: exodeoxyribonuclease VII small subunit [Clostridia bacterium]|nr:exodeoxyribonuclease VII small subunit [Clostridia bacterium]
MAAKKKKLLSFEAGMQELDTLVERLSSGELALEEAIALYEQGTQLHAQLEALLAQQKKRIEMIDPDTAEIEAFEGNE